ncbi:MAG: glycosylase [Planctomycetota bacterium]
MIAAQTSRRRYQWRKLGRVFDPTDYAQRHESWMSEFAQAPSVIVFDDYLRVFFSCRPKPDPRGQYKSYCTYLDVDREDPTRVIRVADHPILPLGELGMFDEFGTYPISVIRLGNTLRGYYAGWTRCESVPFNTAIGVAESSDKGTSFEKLGPGPVIPYTVDEPFVISGPKIRSFNGRFYLYYIAGRQWILDRGRPEPVYKIRLATSDDGLNWEKLGRDLIADQRGTEEAQASPDVVYSGGRYHMFFCHRSGRDYRNQTGGYRIGYAWSEDAIRWHRDDRRAGLETSDAGWDHQMVSYPHVVIVDGKTYLFYLGNDVGKQGFGVAELEGEL